MAYQFFAVLLLLVGTAYVIGRRRALAVAAGRVHELHSLPVYHGLFSAIGVFVPMLAIFVAGSPSAVWLAQSAALGNFDVSIQADPLQRSAILRDVVSLSKGQFQAMRALNFDKLRKISRAPLGLEIGPYWA